MMQIAQRQLQATVELGLRPGGYLWGYRTQNPTEAVLGALQLAEGAGVRLPILWIDLEDAQGPTADWVRTAIEFGNARGYRVGIYTGGWWWPGHMGSAMFPDIPLWDANYNGKADLNLPGYGGMELVAHQWTDKAPNGTGLDRDVFRADYI